MKGVINVDAAAAAPAVDAAAAPDTTTSALAVEDPEELAETVEYVEVVVRKAATFLLEVLGCAFLSEEEKSALARACGETVCGESSGVLTFVQHIAQATGECEDADASRRRRQARFKVTLVFKNETDMAALNATIKATNAKIEASNFTVRAAALTAAARASGQPGLVG